MITALEIEDAHHVAVTGTLWQTYRKGAQDHLDRGFRFPDLAPDPEGLTIEEQFRDETEELEVVAWNFRARLRQKFNFRRFPFDMHQVVITVRHLKDEQNVILVPDLVSYGYINTNATPGLSQHLTVPKWMAEGSYFGYRLTNDNLERGLPGSPALEQQPELQFRILLQRRFLTPFVSYIVPILIVSLLLYGVVILSSLRLEKQEVSGFNIFGVLGTSGGFFLTIALMHVDLRSELSGDVLTYLESLYLIAYLLLVLVSLNALLFIATDAVPWIEYHDNLIPKILFWPLLSGLVLLVTIITFY